MELIHEIVYAVVCVELFLCAQAQVIFIPDHEVEIQLQLHPLRPFVEVVTVQCYSSFPEIKVQYVNEDNQTVLNITDGNDTALVPENTCGENKRKYNTTLRALRFIADPVLIGGAFKLKATVNNDILHTSFSKRTYIFSAPLNLTGSSDKAVLNSPFVWTCHVTSDISVIEWLQGSIILGQIGIRDGNCTTFGMNDSYIYKCQQSSLTYTLVIPGSSLTEDLQGSTWRCKEAGGGEKELIGSKFVKLEIVVPVTTVIIFPGGSGSTYDVDEGQMVNFTCSTNKANPPPTILWYIGSSDVTSQATGSTRTTLTLHVTRTNNKKSVICMASNTENATKLNDSTSLNVRYPPANDKMLQITGYVNGEVLYENNQAMISINCTQPGGNPVVNMTLICGSKTGKNGSTATEAIRRFNFTNDRIWNGQHCVCTSTHINGYMQSKNISFTIVYPPSTPNIINSKPFPWKANESKSLTCNTTHGNPVVNAYIWKEGDSILPVTLQTYYFKLLNSTDNGRQLTCQVNNNFTLHENVVLTSNVTMLQVEYDPVVTLEHSSLEVVEGRTAVLRCSATGNPSPHVTWNRGSTPVTESTISSSNYSVLNISKSMAGNYTCKAKSSSAGNNTLHPDQMTLYLRVFYSPTVSLQLQDTTENAIDHVIRCTAAGDPNNSTFIALLQRIGSKLIRNITSFTESSPGTMTLNIAKVSYHDMGTYTCLASNGIPDRSNQKIQSDTAYFNVTTSAKFKTMQYTVQSDIDKPAAISIRFYRNPPATDSDVMWTKNTATSNGTVVSSANISLSLNDTDVQQTLHGVDVTLKGQSAIMSIASFQNYYEGNYTLKIRSNHADSAEVTVTLIRSGPPDSPSDFQLLGSKVTSVVLTWNKGSDGGHQQTFVILYKEKTAEVYDVKQIVDTTVNVTITDEIEHLKSDTSYEFILYSFNEKGNSTGNRALEERTLKEPSTSTPSSLNSGLVGGAAGGGAALLVIIVVLVVVQKWKRNKREDNDSKGILNGKEMSAGPSKRSDDDEDEGGLKDNPLYGSSPGGANAVQGASAAPENLSQYVAVVKPKKKTPAKESVDPPPIYAEVDKSKKKGKGLMKLKKQSPSRVGEDPPPIYAEVDKSNKKNGKQQKQKTNTGDAYEVVDGFKEKETQFNDPAVAQKTKEGEQRGYRNQDGLLYVDVKFDQPPPTGKPIIRGEERTGYAMIEFEEPPTYSTADDVQGAEGGE